MPTSPAPYMMMSSILISPFVTLNNTSYLYEPIYRLHRTNSIIPTILTHELGINTGYLSRL